MPYQLHWEFRGLEIRLYGRITPAQVRMYEMEVYGDPRFDDLTYIIWNGDAIDSLEVDEALMKESAAYSIGSTRSNPCIKLAMVVCNGRQSKPLRTFIEINKALRSSWRIAVFEDADSARLWATNASDKRDL